MSPSTFEPNAEWTEQIIDRLTKHAHGVAEAIAAAAREYAPVSKRKTGQPVFLHWRGSGGEPGRPLNSVEMEQLRAQHGEFTGKFEKVEAWVKGRSKDRMNPYPLAEVDWAEKKKRGRKSAEQIKKEQLGQNVKQVSTPQTGPHLKESIKVRRNESDDEVESTEIAFDVLADRPYAVFVEYGWSRADGAHYEGAQGGQGFLRKALLESEEMLTAFSLDED